MRVGLVCPYSLTLPGGVQAQVLGIARALRRQGVEARVLGPCDGPPPEAGVTPLGNSLYTHANGSIASIAPDPAAALRTIRALRDEAFDVVHLHEPFVPGPSLTALVFCPSPMVGTFHRAGQGSWYRTLRPVARWTADRLGARVAVSEAAAETARRTMGGQYRVLWNGIDVPQVQRVPPWPVQGPTILFVGRHEERKGLAVLLDAMRRLEGPVSLWVAGEGPETPALRAATSGDGRVQWLGAVDEAQKLRRLRAADVLCAPSLHGESFGVVLLEALAAGAAVVASDLEGYRRVVRNGRDGLLVPPGDADALAGALRQALVTGGRHGPMAEAGRRRAEEFGMDRLVGRYLDVYREVIAARTAGP
ncbi:MAG TPA: glycosyltransferase family 4 protein [Acidimicrobiales bacterium]|nr:glycosyltransferase family 4 protein [Acidimicrobiales bacterium]